jgi:hypothetical protein
LRRSLERSRPGGVKLPLWESRERRSIACRRRLSTMIRRRPASSGEIAASDSLRSADQAGKTDAHWSEIRYGSPSYLCATRPVGALRPPRAYLASSGAGSFRLLKHLLRAFEVCKPPFKLRTVYLRPLVETGTLDGNGRRYGERPCERRGFSPQRKVTATWYDLVFSPVYLDIGVRLRCARPVPVKRLRRN